jgi:hypothetical protein
LARSRLAYAAWAPIISATAAVIVSKRVFIIYSPSG